MRDIKVKITEFREHIEEKLSHPYLLKYITSPSIDEDKLLLLLAIFSDVDIEEKIVKNYALTTMLVQVALDTHENVSNTSTVDKSQQHLKNRQLTVLAGDYFSGLYYYFLAESEDIKMISILAGAIKNINEHKIKLYHSDTSRVADIMNCIEVIESSLHLNITEYFNLPIWSKLSAKFLLFKRLLHEREVVKTNGDSVVYETMRDVLIQEQGNNEHTEKNEVIMHVYDTYIENLKEELVMLLTNNKFKHVLEDRLNELLFIHNFPMNTIVEEG